MNFLKSNIYLENVVHNDLEFYKKSGYGGVKIEKWPFYNFMMRWVNGDTKNAREMWVNWLISEFNKYCFEEKCKGGMYQGSVHKYALINVLKNKNKYWTNPTLIDQNKIKLGAEYLVDRRIEMINSILKNGYDLSMSDAIYAIKNKNFFILKGGHHRAALLYILGKDKIPGVIVFSNFLWRLKEWTTKKKKFLK